MKLLEGEGWYLVSTRGSHRQFKHPTKPGRVTIPGNPTTCIPRRTRAFLGKQDCGDDRLRRTGRSVPDPHRGWAPSNYSAWSPDLPGCVATGATVEETEREMRAAIAFHVEGLAEDGAPVPEPSGPGVYVERKARGAA